MASAGLTRRRGGRVGGEDNDEGSRVSSPVPNSRTAIDARSPETSYTDGENGHKIAYDPRDISENEERTRLPKLTLMDEVLLLGLKDKQVPISVDGI
jgi:golgi phosphoprotein 3